MLALYIMGAIARSRAKVTIPGWSFITPCQYIVSLACQINDQSLWWLELAGTNASVVFGGTP